MECVAAQSNTLDRLAEDAIGLTENRQRAVLGIAGRPGAGKVHAGRAAPRPHRRTEGARLVITEGNYLLLEQPAVLRARRAMDCVWFVTSDEALRVERLLARHVEFGRSPDAAAAWFAGTDQPNADLVSPTAGTADVVIMNGSDGWLISP